MGYRWGIDGLGATVLCVLLTGNTTVEYPLLAFGFSLERHIISRMDHAVHLDFSIFLGPFL